MEIFTLKEEHYPAVARIYEEGIRTGNATFQTTAPPWDEWNSGHFSHTRFVAKDQNEVIGWAALRPVSSRPVYSGVAEVSVYVAERHRGKGVGKMLLGKLIFDSERSEIWTLQAGIFPENESSLKLHADLGFRIIGRRERIGKMNGMWRDTVLLERRSSIVGK